MISPSSFQTQLYAGLRACLTLEFPRPCSNCGFVFQSLEDFIAKTHPVPTHHGLMDYPDQKNNRKIVGLYRNCRCGSTLMALCNDRRDTSPQALQRRQTFDQLLALLSQHNLEADEARNALLHLLHGEKSAPLEKLGITQETFHKQLLSS